MMGKTNFDDLDLDVPGIEADEINAESAAAGSLLAANGLGGTEWRSGPALWRGFIDSEATVSAPAWVTAPLTGEIEDAGFVLVSDEIAIGSGLDGKILMVDVTAGYFAATATGYFKVRLLRKPSGGSWETVLEAITATSSGSEGTVQTMGYRKLVAGEIYKVEVAVTSGSVDLDMNHATVALLAL